MINIIEYCKRRWNADITTVQKTEYADFTYYFNLIYDENTDRYSDERIELTISSKNEMSIYFSDGYDDVEFYMSVPEKCLKSNSSMTRYINYMINYLKDQSNREHLNKYYITVSGYC